MNLAEIAAALEPQPRPFRPTIGEVQWRGVCRTLLAHALELQEKLEKESVYCAENHQESETTLRFIKERDEARETADELAVALQYLQDERLIPRGTGADLVAAALQRYEKGRA